VVVVDDEPEIAKIITRAIRMQHPDYEVSEACDGFQAGTLITTLLPEVVILDLRMPGIDGFETCRMIKANPLTKTTQIIIVTAFPSQENEQRSLECGAKMCLPKPLNLAELVRQVTLLVAEARG
jgi:DNA-binding response OmpR family regulator